MMVNDDDDAPIISSYNDRIRPLLDTVDRLRHLNITQEGIQLPTIVVVGDQSSGKSSVLESLAGISLPRGQGICTRVPLIMRLQNHTSPNSDLSLEFNGKTVPIDEENITEAISLATEEIAGKGKGISNSPLTLVVKKNGVLDLTMVDLPGITRVPVLDQPKDIYEQISKIIMEFITPEESIILNVLSAGVDFSTCESIRMSQQVDKTGQRTLAVVTKADKSPEGLLEKVTADDFNIGLGYVCVRNRIGDESYEEARAEEARLFETHPQLSKISKCIVGMPILAQRLVRIQATIIVKCLPQIVAKINDKLSANLEQLKIMPKQLTSVAEAMTTFVHILGFAKESLRQILLQGEFEEYPDAKEMHGTARLAEMLHNFSKEHLPSKPSYNDAAILIDEIKVLEEAKSIGLPHFLPKYAFLALLRKKVDSISEKPTDFFDQVWNYIEDVVLSVLLRRSENYPQLLPGTRNAVHNLICMKKEQSINFVNDMIQMERLTDYTCNPVYMIFYNELISHQTEFLQAVEKSLCSSMDLGVVLEAFDLKMRIQSYWNIVIMRMVDNMALHLQFSIRKLVNNDMEKEMIKELMGSQGNQLDKMLVESPSISESRKKLESSTKLLKQSKEIINKVLTEF